MNKEDIDRFLQETEASLHAFWGMPTGLQFLQDIHTYAKGTLEKLINIVNAKKVEETLESMVITHLWSIDFKDFVILLRDVSFNYLKASQLEKSSSNEYKNNIKQSSYSIINIAINELKQSVEGHLSEVNKDPRKKEKTISNWKVQNNPWPTILEQTEELVHQMAMFETDYEQYSKIKLAYQDLSNTINNFISTSTNTLEAHKETLNQVQLTINTLQEEDRINHLIASINNLDSSNHRDIQNFSEVNLVIDETLKELGSKYKYPIELDRNGILIKDSNLRSDAKTWLESEIFPMLYEIDDIINLSDTETKMALVNIKNRANLFQPKQSKEDVLLEVSTFNKSINTFKGKIEKHSEELESTIKELKDRLSNNLELNSLFDPAVSNFDTSIEKSIRSFGLRQNKYFKIAKDWLVEKTGSIRDLYKNIEDEDKLSNSERVNLFLDQSFSEDKSASYANIFMTKGYVGESFVVGREKDLLRVDSGVEKWKKGKRGTILLTGQRMSGRTLFGNLVSKRHFVKKTIKLKPNTAFNIAGRNIQSEYDLRQSLSSIVKYGLQENVMVWIDNLELWQNDKISLMSNVKSLLKIMDTHSDKIFFVVSTTHWVSNHLNTHLSWKAAFQVLMNMDPMSRENLAKAISIRHGATHKNLVDKDGSVVSSYNLKRQAAKIHMHAEGIIGLALHYWANSIRDQDSNNVVQDLAFKQFLPQIIDKTTAPVLYSIVMNREANEYTISKWLGGNFQNKYKSTVQRLNHIGLLKRKMDGVLTIEKQLVNEVAQQLHDNQWIDKTL